MSRACRRDQSSPSMSAASCDADSRMTPSLIGGQRNAPSSRRFQYKIRPEPSQAKIFNRSAASSERRGSSQNTDRAEARPSPAPPGCQRHAGSRPASSPQESERQREPQSRRGLHRAQHLRQRRNVGSRTDAHHRCAERDLDRPAWNCAGGCRRWRRTLHNHRRESHAARGGALTTDSSPLRIAPPAEQLLRRQTMSPCDSPDFVPALIAPCENRRLLLRRPRAPSARSGEDLKPSNRLTLRLVQKLSVRHVSNPLPTQTTSDNRPLANALEGAIKGPLTFNPSRRTGSSCARAPTA